MGLSGDEILYVGDHMYGDVQVTKNILRRLELQYLKFSYGPQPDKSARQLEHKIQQNRQRLTELDAQLTPLAIESSQLVNPLWGLLTRAGNEKSHLAFQVEQLADIYTSRVSNFLAATPFQFSRSPRGTPPHDPAEQSGPGISSNPEDSGLGM